mgnify:CR=1 FL=1
MKNNKQNNHKGWSKTLRLTRSPWNERAISSIKVITWWNLNALVEKKPNCIILLTEREY